MPAPPPSTKPARPQSGAAPRRLSNFAARRRRSPACGWAMSKWCPRKSAAASAAKRWFTSSRSQSCCPASPVARSRWPCRGRTCSGPPGQPAALWSSSNWRRPPTAPSPQSIRSCGTRLAAMPAPRSGRVACPCCRRTRSRTSASAVMTCSSTNPRLRPTGRPAPRRACTPWSPRSTSWRWRSTWTRSTCGSRTSLRKARRHPMGRSSARSACAPAWKPPKHTRTTRRRCPRELAGAFRRRSGLTSAANRAPRFTSTKTAA